MTQQLLPFVFLNLAGIFVVIYMLLQREKGFNRVDVSNHVEPLDLTPNFMDLQERITSEAEETRKQQDSHYKNNQTVIKTLTGTVKNLPTKTFINEQFDREIENIIGNTRVFVEESEGRTTEAIKDMTGVVEREFDEQLKDIELINHDATARIIGAIKDDHKKTRKETQEIKTRLTWSRKRELKDLEDEKAEEKQRAELYALIERLAASIDKNTDIQSDLSLPEGTMVLRDEKNGDEVTINNVTPEALVKAAKKANKPKKKRKASK